MVIGFFDSGIGGITVLKEAIKMLPNENYLYYGDFINLPYGTKSKEKVKEFVFQSIEFMERKKVKALVIACNTATSIAIKDARKKYKMPIIGMEPAIKPAVENGDSNKRVLVLATPLTLKEELFKNLISKVDCYKIVDSLPCPELVSFSENFQFKDGIISDYIKEKLSKYDLNNYSTIVLGCTHFTFFKEAFESFVPLHIKIIDGNKGTVKQLKKVLKENINLKREEKERELTFYNSGIKEKDLKRIKFYKDYLKENL